MKQPTISVIIPSLARPSLRALLYSLQKQTIKPEEIVVVFDLPQTKQIKALGKYLFTGGNRGQAVAKNMGAKKAQGDILLFLEDDEIADSKLIKETKIFFTSHPQYSLMAGQIIEKTNQNQIWTDIILNLPLLPWQNKEKIGGVIYPWGRCESHFMAPKPGKCDYAGAGCLAIKRASFLAIGGFDSTLLPGCHFEEADLALRLANILNQHAHRQNTENNTTSLPTSRANSLFFNGQPQEVFYNPQAKVRHLSLGKSQLDYHNLRANEVYFSLKNLVFKKKKTFILFAIYHLWQVLIYLVLSIFKYEYLSRIKGKIKGLKHYLQTRPPKILIDARALKSGWQLTGKEKYLLETSGWLTKKSTYQIIKLKGNLLKCSYQLFIQKITKRRFLLYSPTSFILPSLANFNSVVVVHDLASFKFSGYNNFKALIIERLFLRRALDKSQKIIVPSQSTQQELVNKWPEYSYKIIIIPEG